MACVSSVVKNLASNVEKTWAEVETTLRSLTAKVFKAVGEFFSKSAQFLEGTSSSVSHRDIEIIEPSQNDLKIQALTQRIEELELELRELGESALSKDLEVHLSKQAYQMQENELNATRSEISTLKHQLDTQASQKSSLESQISQLRKQLQAEKVEQGQENESLLRKNSELIQKLEILTEQKNGVEEQITTLSQKLEGAKTNEAELEGQISALKAKLEATICENTGLSERIQTETVRKNEVEAQIAALGQQLEGAKTNEAELEGRIAGLKAELETAVRENAGLRQGIETAQKTSSIAQEEMQKWEATIELAEKQKETLKEENDLLKREMDEMRRFQRLNKPVDEVSIDPSLLRSIFNEEPKPQTWANLVARHPNGIPQGESARQPSTPSLAKATPVKIETPVEPAQLPSSSSSSSSIAPEASTIVEDEELSEKAALRQKAEALRDQLDEKIEPKYHDLKRELKQIIVMMALGGGKEFNPAARLESIEQRVLQYEGKVKAEASIEEIEVKKEERFAEVIEKKEVSSSVIGSSEKKAKNAKKREKRALEAAALKKKTVSKPQPKKVNENATDCSASLARIAADLEARQAFWAEQKPKAIKISNLYGTFISQILLTQSSLSHDSIEIQEKLNQLEEKAKNQLEELKKVGGFGATRAVRADLTFDSSDQELLVSELGNFERRLIELESEFTDIESEIVQEVATAQAKKPVATLGSRFLSTVTFGYLGTAQ